MPDAGVRRRLAFHVDHAGDGILYAAQASVFKKGFQVPVLHIPVELEQVGPGNPCIRQRLA
ncbi:hypothetical protein UB46_25425 [Burkholderiaceae bacterium 16]|nr:hypothetical protein UB46_25425 [Burkholderiaceae bacterium 16]